ncbi:MAG TPA: hypothetical protein VFL91_28015 [Thermomicrobiales bacterium]|nr:hypothetical protein [Thermomicrobiales bacterium]
MQRTGLSQAEQQRLDQALAGLQAQLAAEAARIARAYGARSPGARLAGRLARSFDTLRGILDDERCRDAPTPPGEEPAADGERPPVGAGETGAPPVVAPDIAVAPAATARRRDARYRGRVRRGPGAPVVN